MPEPPDQPPDDPDALADDVETSGDRRVRLLRRIGWPLLGALLAGALGMLVFSLLRGNSVPQHRMVTTITRVVLPPPPPPPPKEPPPEPPKMVEQPRVQEPEPQPKAAEKPAPKPSSPLTGAAGSGPNPYGLQIGNGDGNSIGGGGGGGGGGSNFGFYAGLIQSQVQGAIKRDELTRFGRFRVSLKLWLSPTGQVTRTQLVSSSGDAAVDGALARLLTGLSLGEPPPAGMPQPVNIRIGAEPG